MASERLTATQRAVLAEMAAGRVLYDTNWGLNHRYSLGPSSVVRVTIKTFDVLWRLKLIEVHPDDVKRWGSHRYVLTAAGRRAATPKAAAERSGR